MSQSPPTRLTDNLVHIRAIQDGMVGTMYDPRGTGRATAVGAPYRMAGKTGTAQRVSRKGNVSTNPHLLPLHLRHQAWFIGYAPAQDPEIAVAVMVEHGGYGGSTAAPLEAKARKTVGEGKMGYVRLIRGGGLYIKKKQTQIK